MWELGFLVDFALGVAFPARPIRSTALYSLLARADVVLNSGIRPRNWLSLRNEFLYKLAIHEVRQYLFGL